MVFSIAFLLVFSTRPYRSNKADPQTRQATPAMPISHALLHAAANLWDYMKLSAFMLTFSTLFSKKRFERKRQEYQTHPKAGCDSAAHAKVYCYELDGARSRSSSVSDERLLSNIAFTAVTVPLRSGRMFCDLRETVMKGKSPIGRTQVWVGARF